MPRETIGLTTALAALACAAGCEWASGLTGAGRPPAAAPAAPAQPVALVEVVRPARLTVRRSVEEPGQVEACETTPVYARISGYVRKVHVDIGSRVAKGQAMVELSAPEVEADAQEKRAAVDQAVARRAQRESAVKVAQAAILSAEARVAEARAGVKRADADLARWGQEARRVEQLVNERAQTGTLLDETRNKLRSAESTAEEVRARVKTAEAASVEASTGLEQARSDVAAAAAGIEVARSESRRAGAMLGYARIDAPFDGVVTRCDVDTGHLTVPGGAGGGAPLLVVARTDVVTVAVDVPESFATEVEPGNPVLLRLPSAGGRVVEGKVTRTAWALEPKARTVRAEVDLPNPGGRLRPGLYVYATVVVGERKDVLTLPASALVKVKGESFCVVVVGGKAAWKAVEVGLGDGVHSEIRSGLDGTEAVVKANAGSLAEGQTVRVVEPAVQAPTKGKS